MKRRRTERPGGEIVAPTSKAQEPTGEHRDDADSQRKRARLEAFRRSMEQPHRVQQDTGAEAPPLVTLPIPEVNVPMLVAEDPMLLDESETTAAAATPVMGFDYAKTHLRAEEKDAMARPPLIEPIDRAKEFIFQIVSCQASYVSPIESPNKQWIRDEGRGQVPVMRLYGVTPEGQSVGVNVWNFHPYLFVNAPLGTSSEEEGANLVGDALEEVILAKQRSTWKGRGANPFWQPVTRAEETLDQDPHDLLMHLRHGGEGPIGGLDRIGEVDSDSDGEDDAEAVHRGFARAHHDTIADDDMEPKSYRMDSQTDDSRTPAWRKKKSSSSWTPPPPVAVPKPKVDTFGPRVVNVIPERYKIAEHFQIEPTLVYRVELRTPNMVTMVRDAIGEGPDANAFNLGNGRKVYLCGPTYESGVRFENRFMIDHGIVGTGWVGLRAGAFHVTPLAECATRCTIELDVVDPTAVTGYGVKDFPELYDQPSRMRRLAYDIECDNEGGRFPDPKLDPVINIHVIGIEVADEEKITLDVALILGSADPVGKEGQTRTVCFETERELLNAWADLQIEFDADIITGYNSSNFDNRYIVERAKTIGATRVLETSRCYTAKVEGKIEQRLSKNLGNSERYNLKCEGRVYIDMLPYVQHNLYEKLRSYKLNAVAAEVLKDQKDDIDHTQIPILHRGTSADRKRLGDYCRKDALLAHQLMTNLMALVALFELSRVQRVQLDQQQNGGASFKVFSQLLHHFRRQGFIVPYRRHLVKREYQGATVFDPVRGYYNETPIASLDFGSLYPSIAIAYNACTTTHVLDSDLEAVLDHFGFGDAWRAARDEEDVETIRAIAEEVFYVCPVGNRYVRAKYFKGVFCSMLEELLELRDHAKQMMGTTKDQLKKKVYNQRQLSLKTAANSGYGFFGLVSNGVYWFWVSETITACGRQQIALTKELVEEEFTVAKGYPGDAKVIYGDTDSVLVVFGPSMNAEERADPVKRREVMAKIMELGTKAAALCSAKFPKPNKLNFENAYFPYLLITKKRYGGQMWTNPDKPMGKLKIQGLESKRRDNCKLVAWTQEKCLELILRQGDPDKALELAQRQIRALLEGKVDFHDLVISQQLKCYQADYKTPQAHAQVRELMEERNPGSGPKIGERVPYVLVKRDRTAKRYQCAEDPLYALEHRLQLNVSYYLENQMLKPLIRVFAPIYGEAKADSLIKHGEHTRHINRHISLQPEKGLGRFFTTRPSCRNCGVSLKPGDEETYLLCHSCEPERIGVCMSELSTLRKTQGDYARIWTNCQSCQGSLFKEVICSAQDCPVFYKRVALRQDLEEQQKRFAALSREIAPPDPGPGYEPVDDW